jgi:hypothetical protein
LISKTILLMKIQGTPALTTIAIRFQHHSKMDILTFYEDQSTCQILCLKVGHKFNTINPWKNYYKKTINENS